MNKMLIAKLSQREKPPDQQEAEKKSGGNATCGPPYYIEKAENKDGIKEPATEVLFPY
jgi:hypothetical protein